jgi:hypothetical protein
LKIHYSYLAFCVAATLQVPQAFAEEPQASLEPAINAENIEPQSDLSTNSAEESIESYENSQHENPEIESTSLDPVEDLSSFYSDMDMRMRLAVKADAKPCNAETCAENQAFDAKVQLIGESLAKSAYSLYPDLKKTTPKFEFAVADKKVLGSASNASGTIVLFRGIQHLDLDDDATAFIIGREMGHVIARHHKSNAKTKIFFTVLTAVLFPAASLISASSAAAQATTATTLMTSAASTVTSFVGSEVALSRIKPSQLTEADDISIALLEYGGVTAADTAQSLAFIVEDENSVGWEKDLNLSIQNVIKLAGEPLDVMAQFELLPDEYAVSKVNLVDPEVGVTAPVKLQISKPQTPIGNHAAKLDSHQLLPEQKLVEPKLLEPKPIEQPKTIWITNESIAQNSKPRNIVPVNGKAEISGNLRNSVFKSGAQVNKNTKKVTAEKVTTKNAKGKKTSKVKNDKHNVKKTSVKSNNVTFPKVNKTSKTKVVKVLKKSDSNKK